MNRREVFQFGALAASTITVAGVPLHLLAAETKGGTVNTIVQPEPTTLILGMSQAQSTQLVAGNIYEGLFRYDEKLNPIPHLVSSWTQNKEGTLYTFKLKPGVVWHDGKPFTSADVVFAIDVYLRKMHTRGRTNLAAVETIRAIDPLTVEFRLKHPFGPFLTIFEVGSMPMVPKHIYEGTDFATNPANATPIGTGPFKFKSWSKGSHIHLTANEAYHVKDLPKIKDLYWHVIPDAASRAAAFESGKIDIAPGGSVEFFDVQRLAKLPNVALTQKGYEFLAPIAYICLNNRKAPMNNVDFRRAVMHAIDREAVCKIAWQGFAKPATGPFNSNLKYYTADVTRYPRDLQKAKKLLAASGYKGEKLRLLAMPYGEAYMRTAEIVRQNLGQAGIQVEMVSTDVPGWNQKLAEWDFDLAFNGLYQYGDPALGVSRNYTTANIVKGFAFNNVQGYSNPKVDELFDAGARETDPAKRQEIYTAVQRTLVDDVPVAWMYEITFPTLYRQKVKNPISSAIGLNDGFGWASVE